MPKRKPGKRGPKPIFKEPVTVALRVERKEYERVERIAAAERVNVSAIVRRAIGEYLERTRRHGARQ